MHQALEVASLDALLAVPGNAVEFWFGSQYSVATGVCLNADSRLFCEPNDTGRDDEPITYAVGVGEEPSLRHFDGE